MIIVGKVPVKRGLSCKAQVRWSSVVLSLLMFKLCYLFCGLRLRKFTDSTRHAN